MSRTQQNLSVLIVVVSAMLMLAARNGVALPTLIESPLPSAVTYVYEKDNTPLYPQVSAGLNRLNRERKIRATAIDDDVLDGTGQVPEQYKVAIPAAQEAGLPALVVTAGDTVLKVVKDPTTVEQVWGAVP